MGTMSNVVKAKRRVAIGPVLQRRPEIRSWPSPALVAAASGFLGAVVSAAMRGQQRLDDLQARELVRSNPDAYSLRPMQRTPERLEALKRLG